VSHAGLWVLRRNDDDITQAAGTPKQCFKTGGIDAIVIGYYNFQNVFLMPSCRMINNRTDLKPRAQSYPQACDSVKMAVFKKTMQPSHHMHVASGLEIRFSL
jgi:hypothetical protein